MIAALPAMAAATPTLNFTTSGSYVVTVPPTARSVHLTALGGAGEPGGTAPSNYGDGGSGGHGDQVSEDMAIAPDAIIAPGSTFTVTVGALGGAAGVGGRSDSIGGAPFAGAGGKGGGATWITAQDGTFLIVAGGGGGGGGGNGSPGGAGGTQGPGQATSIGGVTAAQGGAYGGSPVPREPASAYNPARAERTPPQTSTSVGVAAVAAMDSAVAAAAAPATTARAPATTAVAAAPAGRADTATTPKPPGTRTPPALIPATVR